MLQCVIIDDEPLARGILEEFLQKSGITGAASFANARDALAHLQTHETDVLFLDIEMPEMNGIDFLKSLAQPPVTVFTTAYRGYAFEGYELGVIDFLLKPISYARFGHALDKVRDFLQLKEQNTNLEQNLTEEKPDFIFVKSGVQRVRLAFDDIAYIQGLKDYAIIHTGAGKVVIKGSVKAMLEIFPPARFLRVHKSFIVGIDKIRRIERNRIVWGNHQIPIGRNYREEVMQVITQ
ncbi:LytR/AlgR family response regulator transcription factor [Dyadobacter fermentans]|uniref:Two component transcriptional regulator, LytTR family n=1 Tax=Dyadobacter fermentans (strain ATCC 700827 / DSM 18053 / CIP 107007 / KCTC 52180 / NS114) TaxID=471854 RepID=C6VU69_DYAFD|nr:LytTR family DNA-binding domain-containing protein [Dyadobacter fermentans]ACT96551.1 two component transcriptional regulator, LytTR family [Dyadobacter fermentans DSM 18053]